MNCKECYKEQWCPFIHYFNHNKDVGCIEFVRVGEQTIITTTNSLNDYKENKQ